MSELEGEAAVPLPRKRKREAAVALKVALVQLSSSERLGGHVCGEFEER
jgi:hypothetical protein